MPVARFHHVSHILTTLKKTQTCQRNTELSLPAGQFQLLFLKESQANRILSLPVLFSFPFFFTWGGGGGEALRHWLSRTSIFIAPLYPLVMATRINPVHTKTTINVPGKGGCKRVAVGGICTGLLVFLLLPVLHSDYQIIYFTQLNFTKDAD